MQFDVSNLRPTIIPKSDQLNADQLVGGPMTVTVSEVRVTSSDDQPVIVHYEGENGRPYKPCKTMRKVLIFAWGEDGREWVGRSMTLYHDASVRFGGSEVGGIRISHMSHIDKEIRVNLTATKGKKALNTISPLEVVSLETVLNAIKSAKGRDDMAKARALAEKLIGESDIETAKKAYADKVTALKNKSAAPPSFADQIAAATDLKTLQEIGESMDSLPDGHEKEALAAALLAREDAITK